jgi:hypothetical protein
MSQSTLLQNAAAEPGETAVGCTRCNSTGQYRHYGECYRCNGTGLVSPAKIKAYFLEREAPDLAQPSAPAPVAPVVDGRALAKAAAKARAAELTEIGFRGRIRAFPDRVELLARTRSRPGETLHLTWWPGGFAEEWLPGSPSANWPHILKG